MTVAEETVVSTEGTEDLADQSQGQAENDGDESSTDAKATDEKDGADGDDDDGEEPHKSGRGVQRRINVLTAEKYEYKARAELAERMLREKSASASSSESVPSNGEPSRDAFDTDAEYEDAVVDYRIEQKVSKAVAKQLQKEQTEKTVETWEQRKNAAKKEMPDYDEVMQESTTRLSPAMEEAILSSENGAHLAYYLAKNPKKAAEIFKLSPSETGRMIGIIEATLKPQSRKGVSGAPPPVNPVAGNRGVSTKDPEKMSMAEFAAWRNRQKK
jgi:hypothetical protein